MTDTPPPGAADAARDTLTVTKLEAPRSLTPAEADAVFQARTLVGQPGPGVLDLSSVVVDASILKPQFTALLRWLLQGLGVWLVAHGMAASRADGLMAIAGGLAMSGGSLAWSWAQKRLAAQRIRRAALADPAKVVLR